MLNVLSNLIALLSQAFAVFFITKIVSKSSVKLLSLKTISVLLLFCVGLFLNFNVEYAPTQTIITFLLMIATIKISFNETLSKSIVLAGITTIAILLADMIYLFFTISFITAEEMRSNEFYMLIGNIMVSTLAILLIMIPTLKRKLVSLVSKIKSKENRSMIIYVALIILVISLSIFNISQNYGLNYEYLINVLTVFLFSILFYIFMEEKNNKLRAVERYDNLLDYVQEIEMLIETERLNIHESKNQLATIKDMISKDSEAIAYIESIIKEKNALEDKLIPELSDIPKGGLKGLLYYKLNKAKSKGLEIMVNVDKKINTSVKKLTLEEQRSLCHLIGIYMDNAIEAAMDTDKKILSIEIYLSKNSLNIVISNSLKETTMISNFSKKGFSTKGKNRGQGLFYAQSLLEKNAIFSSESNIVNNYYIQKMKVKIKEAS